MMNYERTDVVFVVEKSVSMKRYLPELLENYITPTVSCFGSGLSEESDVFFTQSSVVQYASVFFGTELSLIGSWGQVECYGPTCSETEIINSIKNARYTCKNLSRQAFILDGLQASLNMFETMKKSSGGGDNVQKVCVLVTQSTPMSNPWSPTNPEKVLIELKRTKIQLSVVSAHKLVELYRLFDAAGGDLPTPNKNYASKPQHLVLLNGFSLQERAVSPSLMGYTQTGSVATPPAALGNQVTQPGVPVQTTGGPGPSPNPMGPIATAPSPGPGGSPAPPQPGQTQLVRGPGVNPMVVGCNLPNQPNPSMPVGSVLRPSMPIARVINPTRPRWPVEAGGVVGGTVPWQAGPGPRPPGMAVMVNQQPPQTVQGEVIGPKSQPGGGPSQFSDVDASLIGQPQPPLQQVPGGAVGGVGQAGMNPPNQRLVVWQGALEWQEKKADNNSRVVHQVTCKMTSLVVNGEPEVKADHWSQTLIMQMIPKHILGNIGNTFFKNVKTVMFLPDQSHALEILTNFLFRGMAGCVHVSHASAQQGEVKVIILLYSSEKKAYVGFIPIDQFSFVNKIKSVIQSARKGQMTGGMMSQGVSGPGGVPGPGGPHMVVQSSTGLQQLSSNPGAGMNVMPSQSMIIQQNPQLTQALSQPISQAGPTLLAGGQMSQLASGAVSQAMGQQGPGAGPVNVQMAAGPSVLATQLTTRPTLNIQQQQAQQQQQQQQQQPDLLQMRQNQPQQQQQHHTAIRQQLQQQLQQRPGGMNMTGGSTSLNQPRMMQTAMATPSGLKQLLQQQQHVRLQHQQVQQHQQQQQQQQHIIMMQQQQGMRPQMTGQGQQVMGQAIGQQGMSQQSLTQQNMNQQGIGQPLAESNQDYLDLL